VPVVGVVIVVCLFGLAVRVRGDAFWSSEEFSPRQFMYFGFGLAVLRDKPELKREQLFLTDATR
jgi:hypothetical protein